MFEFAADATAAWDCNWHVFESGFPFEDDWTFARFAYSLTPPSLEGIEAGHLRMPPRMTGLLWLSRCTRLAPDRKFAFDLRLDIFCLRIEVLQG